ncbi:acyclic terpene utilization AtuA family protein [Amycolatopsis thermalba]|uniref:acyclic terpene utilization AtuA family protein n=1 Tax=Amycolatopsis thermalba TaxID=944492 RepID=UPI000E21EEFA|nr:acyclic terpene utilization AtuA family protein [Amycolatopsis thermalba]
MKDTVRIGCFAAFWGDTKTAIPNLLDGAEIDYLVADYLSEITMALLARARAKDPAAGYVADFVTTIEPVLPQIAERGIKIVCNAGALNPVAAARAVRAAGERAGVQLTVAAVEGDDVLPRAHELADATDMFTGRPLPAKPGSMNAYLGARPVAAALAAGADVVVTGRCVDAAVVLGPLMHEFGWKDDEYDLLAAGSLVGHLVECGPQVTGGNTTDWAEVPGWENMGYPVAEVRPDGTAVITKPRGTGGLVTPLTVGEQMLYEIGDPGAYLMPDVVCDWREVILTQDGENRVLVRGAKGSAPTTTYKVTATAVEGYRALTTAMFAGVGAAGKARRMAEALIARTERLIAGAGFEPLAESSIEVVGAGDVTGSPEPGPGTETVVKIGVKHTDKAALEIFSTEFAAFALIAQGMTGVFAGRPRVAPSIAVYHLLVPKAETPVRLVIGDSDDAERTVPVDISPGTADAVTSTERLPESTAPAGGRVVPLVEIAVARSGDKGNLANIGLLARKPEYAEVLRTQVTAERIAAHFAQVAPSEVRRWAVPGVHGINIVLDEVLGGTGGTSTLRYDPQGKSFGAMLLSLPVTVSEEASS